MCVVATFLWCCVRSSHMLMCPCPIATFQAGNEEVGVAWRRLFGRYPAMTKVLFLSTVSGAFASVILIILRNTPLEVASLVVVYLITRWTMAVEVRETIVLFKIKHCSTRPFWRAWNRVCFKALFHPFQIERVKQCVKLSIVPRVRHLIKKNIVH